MDVKIAIVGMEAIFGPDEGLDVFDRSIFDGVQHPDPIPPDTGTKTRTGIKAELKEAYIRLLDNTGPPSATALLQKAIDGAMQNVTSKVTKSRWSGVALIVVSEESLSSLKAGPRRVLREDSLAIALQTAEGLLSKQEIRGVVIASVHMGDRDNTPSDVPGFKNGLNLGDGAGAVFLKRADQAIQDQDRIYATIDAVILRPGPSHSSAYPSGQEVVDTCTKAFDIAGIEPRDIGYIEVMGQGIDQEDPRGMECLVQAYQTSEEELTCALGSVQSNIRWPSSASGLASLIKTALCLYHRYIPATPCWTNPKDMELWENSPFYIATESRPWFVDLDHPTRVAAISSVEPNEVAHLVLSEYVVEQSRPNSYLALVSPYCFPLAGDDQTAILSQLEALKQTVETTSNLSYSAKENLAVFEKKSQAAYAVMVVGYTSEELLQEIEFMIKGIPATFENGSELKTPKGSYFTANPLGCKGEVTFVYPGVGSAYVGLGHGLFHLFPGIYEQSSRLTDDIGAVLKEKELYPRSRERLARDQISDMDKRMSEDIMTIANSGMTFFALYTMILRDIFKVTPHSALGYSMGEPGMMASLGVWPDPLQLTHRFSNSPTFRERLHGKLNAVREHWNLNGYNSDPEGELWDCYTLRANRAVVEGVIKNEDRVFLTIVNTPEEVVIAGDPEGCTRVIKEIGCKCYNLGFGLAIHCDPTRLEYDRIVDIYTLPVNRSLGIKFYSSSCYKSIPIRSKAVAHSIAKAFCDTVDFPRLVNQAYEDGARVFIELGSRKFCCHLIEKILKDKDHLTIPMNAKGTKDQTSMVRVLAKLVSHRVPVDLSPVF